MAVPSKTGSGGGRISVVICTRKRLQSLSETLRLLAEADRTQISAEVAVVDNAGCSETESAVGLFADRLQVRYLTESKQGKCHALNRALDSGLKGDLIAVLDDDMSPRADWFQGVFSISGRWPSASFFTGSSYIIWPNETLPAWALRPGIRSWVYSVMPYDGPDRIASPGRWFSGNHFWFRADVLRNGRRFIPGSELSSHIEMSEPRFMLDLVEDGHFGIQGSDAVVGHRVQPELLDLALVRRRAARVGRGFAEARVQTYRQKVKQAYLLRRHPLLARLFCCAECAGWMAAYFLSFAFARTPAGIELNLKAIERSTFYREVLHIASSSTEYRLRLPSN